MPSGNFYRTQAQLVAKLALASSDPSVVARYNLMALEYLAKAEEVEPNAGQTETAVRIGGGGDSDMDRD